MNKRIVIGIAIMAMVATAVQAATMVSKNGVSANWTGTGTWGTSAVYPGELAGGADLSRIVGGSTITMNSDIPAANALGNVQVGYNAAGNLIIDSGAYMRLLTPSTLTIGQGGVGTLVMNGGTVTGKTVTVSLNAGIAGSSIAMHGGTIDIEGQFHVGKGDAGTMTMDGGNIFASKLLIGDTLNTTASTVSLTGGTLTLLATNGLAINTAAGSELEIGPGGTLIIGGNSWGVIEAYVNSLDIVWDTTSTVISGVGDKTWHNWDGQGYIHTDYDALTDKTTVWVNNQIPEPATVGMLGLGALIVLLVRRMRG